MIQPWKHKPRYGVEETYKLGMEWLNPCSLVEDWGCALCHARTYRVGDYVGIDGTPGKAQVIADLSLYRSQTPGLFMRHILEHNRDWRVILDNALASFTQRMSLILFRPLATNDTVFLGKRDHIDINLCGNDLMAKIRPYLRSTDAVSRYSGKIDTVFLLSKE